MFTPTQVYLILGFFLGLTLGLNGWAIYRGLLFIAEHNVPGLELQNNALAFTTTLLGNVYFDSNNFNNVFKSSTIIVFNHSNFFPSPNINNLNYPEGQIQINVNTNYYTRRCLNLDSIIPPTDWYFYGNTVMKSNGTGLRGTLCQESFANSNSFTQIDSLCTGLACMTENGFIGCIPPANFLFFHIDNCGQQNSLKKGLHWSSDGTNNITKDNDINMRNE